MFDTFFPFMAYLFSICCQGKFMAKLSFLSDTKLDTQIWIYY